MKRYGFFGGCFNPPTVTHIELIEKAIKEFKLDKVFFVPMGDLYRKEELIPAFHRVNMLKLVLKDKMEILNISIDSKVPLQAIDTFKIIDKNYPFSENYFIMGSDNFAKIKFWKNAEELLKNYKYIVLKRDNNISSSLVRANLKKDKDVSKLICKDVEKYILENKLYK